VTGVNLGFDLYGKRLEFLKETSPRSWPAPVSMAYGFDLAINETTAAALGVNIPPEVAAQVTKWVR
jgi:ABC-type uncharacterized transport system substrate-binding protein